MICKMIPVIRRYFSYYGESDETHISFSVSTS